MNSSVASFMKDIETHPMVNRTRKFAMTYDGCVKESALLMLDYLEKCWPFMYETSTKGCPNEIVNVCVPPTRLGNAACSLGSDSTELLKFSVGAE